MLIGFGGERSAAAILGFIPRTFLGNPMMSSGEMLLRIVKRKKKKKR